MEEKEVRGSTFIVQIKCMENETWQGKVIWAEKNRAQYFRSSLELLKLMDRALLDETLSLEDEDEEDGDAVRCVGLSADLFTGQKHPKETEVCLSRQKREERLCG